MAILVFAVPGALWALKRGTIGPLLLLGSVGLVLLIVFPRVSPYAQGKLLAIGAPAVLFAALLFPALMRGRLAGAGRGAAWRSWPWPCWPPTCSPIPAPAWRRRRAWKRSLTSGNTSAARAW